MNEKIEILEGVFYDPSVPFYEQDNNLVLFVISVMDTSPIEYSDTECIDGSRRMNRGMWESQTDFGLFSIEVLCEYLYPPKVKPFLTRIKQDILNIKKLEA